MSEVTFTFSGKMIPAGLNPTHEDIFGKGGFVALTGDAGSLSNESLITNFLNGSIIAERRKVGMLVYISSLNQYYTCSNTSAGTWDRKYFSGRYFHGAAAPTATDIQLGEKWFNTTVGSEFTYLPTDEDQDTFFWVDIDHLGQGETGFVRISGDVMTGALTTPFVTMTQGFTSSNGFIGTLTGTSSSFTSLTASNGFIGTLTGTSSSFTSLTAPNGFIGTLTGTNSSFTSLTASNGFIGTLTGTNSSFTSLTASNGFIGTLTGTNASFTGLTTSNGFIGTLTGTNIRYTNAEFGTDSLIIQGSSATFTDMSVMITGDYSFDVGVLSIGQTSSQGTQNSNVPIIKSQGGVLIGGNTDSKQNWLGNNTYLSPEGYSFVGIPNDVPTSWFNVEGGTYPFNLQSLNVTGGIHTDRAFRWGHKKGLGNTYLDEEFTTKSSSIFRDKTANPNGQPWRWLRFGGLAGNGSQEPDYLSGATVTFDINGYRDLGFTEPYDIQVVRIPATAGTPKLLSINTIKVSAKGLTWGNNFSLKYIAGATPPFIVFDQDDKSVKIKTTNASDSSGTVYQVFITPGTTA